jgi:hypothetical protein
LFVWVGVFELLEKLTVVLVWLVEKMFDGILVLAFVIYILLLYTLKH